MCIDKYTGMRISQFILIWTITEAEIRLADVLKQKKAY